MKNIVNVVKEKEDKLFKTADTFTYEGEKAWSISDKERLIQYAMTGVLGRTFYVSQKEIIEEAIELVKRSDANDLAEAIVIGRNEGYIRSFPILGLVYLSMKDTNLFKKAFSDVIKTGGDLGDFIDICHGVRGFGRAVKKVMIEWINHNINPYYALKYRKQIADAIRITRIKSDDCIYSFILRDVVNVSKEKIEESLEKYKELKAFTEIPNLLQEKNYEQVAKLIVDFRLDVDSLTSFYNQFDKTIWLAIAKQSPVMRFIKYLNKFERVGIDVFEIAKSKITVENLKKAKVFPFRLFMVYNELNSSNQKIANLIANVLDDYIKQYDWDKFNQKTWAICPDVSGSMSGICGSNGNLRYIDIAAMFTAFLAKGVGDCVVYPWAGSVKDYKIPFSDSVISQMNYIQRMGGGGTNMSCAIELMIKNNIKRDILVFITDTESYNHKSAWGGNGTSWIEAWVKYHNKYPKSKAIVIRGDCYNNQPMSEQQCEQYNIYQIFGWNDKVIDYIQRIV